MAVCSIIGRLNHSHSGSYGWVLTAFLDVQEKVGFPEPP